MELSNLTFVVTDQCNFRCTYCPQDKQNNYISTETIDKALDFFYPYLRTDKKVYIGFYGGEPLLACDKIKHTIRRVDELNEKLNASEKKHISFSLTTNGTLLTDEKLELFNEHTCSLTLSFDGLAQDAGRQKGSLQKVLPVMKKLRGYPGIDAEINSVFTPATLPIFNDSMRFLVENGAPDITFNFSAIEEWKPSDIASMKSQLDELGKYLLAYYRDTGNIPIKNYQPQPGYGGQQPAGGFVCAAAKQRMSVTPDGKVWGCYVFHDYFKTRRHDPQYEDFSLGTIDEFIAGHDTQNSEYKKVYDNYADLRQDLFQVEGSFCFLCPQVKSCMTCPVYAAYTTGKIGKITCRQCNINSFTILAGKQFQKEAFGLKAA